MRARSERYAENYGRRSYLLIYQRKRVMAEEPKITPQDHAASIALELYLSAINSLRLAAVTVSPYRSRLQVPGGAAAPCDAILAVASQALEVAVQLGQQSGLLQAMPQDHDHEGHDHSHEGHDHGPKNQGPKLVQ